MDRPCASTEEARIGSAAFFEPDTRTSPVRRAPPRMTIFCKRRYVLRGGRAALGGGSPLGRGHPGVLVTEPTVGSRLAASFLAAALVAVVVAHVAAAPADEVLAAQALCPHRLLALVDRAGLGAGLGRYGRSRRLRFFLAFVRHGSRPL